MGSPVSCGRTIGPIIPLHTGARADNHPILIEAERQLEEYFAGSRKEFSLNLDVAGTPFQRKVWNALRMIPFGETRSYGEIAKQIGSPGAMRAVGAANGRNPVSIVVPCHRVIGSHGKLTGFRRRAQAKAQLLALEGVPHTEPGQLALVSDGARCSRLSQQQAGLTRGFSESLRRQIPRLSRPTRRSQLPRCRQGPRRVDLSLARRPYRKASQT